MSDEDLGCNLISDDDDLVIFYLMEMNLLDI
jgi:hypothetical protein